MIKPKIKYCRKTTFEEAIIDNEFIGGSFSSNPTSKIKIENTTIDCCVFKGIDFTNSIEFKNVEIWDSIFENCDLSNFEFNNRSLHRCQFINCRLVGVNFINCSLKDVLFNNVQALYLNMVSCNIKDISFENSNLEKANLTDNKIKNMLINESNFSEAEIQKTSLKDVDFSNSTIDGIMTDLDSLVGIKVNSIQALDLIKLLGIEVI